MIDHIITRRRDLSECLTSRVMRSTQCSTDHMMQRTSNVASVRPPVRKKGMTSRKLNTVLLKSERTAMELENLISNTLCADMQNSSTSVVSTENLPEVTEEWAMLSKKLYDTSAEQLEFQKKRHRDWLDESNEEIVTIVKEKNLTHNNYLSRPTRANKLKWKELQRRVQRTTRDAKDKWWGDQARIKQRCADEGRIQAFYEGIKRVSGNQ